MHRFLVISSLLCLAACGGRIAPKPTASGPENAHAPGLIQRTFTVATVEQYPNGLSLVQHPLGDSAVAKLQSAGWTGTRLKDAEVVPGLFIGARDFPDLLVFGGHGTHYGPALTTDPGWSMVPGNYFWGTSPLRPLRWFYNDSCNGLNDGVTRPDQAPRWDAVPGSYWYLGVWIQAMNGGNHGMHAYIGHRGLAWATQANTGSAYAIARSLQGESVGQAWFEAAALDLAMGVPGDLPAVMSAYDQDSGRDWFDESLARPWPDPHTAEVSDGTSASGHRNLAYHYAVIGFPVLPAAPSLDAPRQIHGAASLRERFQGALAATPHRLQATDQATDFIMEGAGPALEALLASTGLGLPSVELQHYVQRGDAPPVRAGSFIPIRLAEGKVAVLRVDAEGHVERVTVRE